MLITSFKRSIVILAIVLCMISPANADISKYGISHGLIAYVVTEVGDDLIDNHTNFKPSTKKILKIGGRVLIGGHFYQREAKARGNNNIIEWDNVDSQLDAIVPMVVMTINF